MIIFPGMFPRLWKQPSLSSCVSPWLSHHLPAHAISLRTPPPCSHHLLLTPPPCSHHLLLTPSPCSHHLLAHFTLTPPPCSHHLLLTPPPCSLYSHTTSLLTLLSHHFFAHTTSVWHQMWEWEVPTPSSPLWPQLGVLWLNSVLKHSLNI